MLFTLQRAVAFRDSPAARLKENTPNLGELLVMLTLVDGVCFQDVAFSFVREVWDRNVLWMLRSDHELQVITGPHAVSDAERLTRTFHACRTSFRLVMFQVLFLTEVGRPVVTSESVSRLCGPAEVLARYNRSVGRPPEHVLASVYKQTREVLNVASWPKFFERCKLPCPSQKDLIKMLKEAIVNSRAKGYHAGHRHAGHRGR